VILLRGWIIYGPLVCTFLYLLLERKWLPTYPLSPTQVDPLGMEFDTAKQDECGKWSILSSLSLSLWWEFNLGARSTPVRVERVPYVPMLKEDNVRKGFFEHEEYLAVRETISEHLKDVVTFGYNTGWRISEITGLTWPQVDQKAGVVRLEVGETKNDEGRVVFMDDETREMLLRRWQTRKRPLPWVFLNAKGTDRVKRFTKAWRTACRKAGFPGRLFHDLRRTAVRNMVRAMISERVAMKISGHKTRSVFDRYNIVSEADLKRAARQLQEHLAAQKAARTVTPVDFGARKAEGEGSKAVREQGGVVPPQ
jgi:integrase